MPCSVSMLGYLFSLSMLMTIRSVAASPVQLPETKVLHKISSYAFLIDRMNRYINKHFQYVNDAQQFRENDIWLSSDEFQRTGKGDCEDFAIAKYGELKLIDPAIDARVAYVKYQQTKIRRAGAHMVVVYRRHAEDSWKVLDNNSNRIDTVEQRDELRPVYMFKLAADGRVSLVLLNADWSLKAAVSNIHPNFVQRVTFALAPPRSFIMDGVR